MLIFPCYTKAFERMADMDTIKIEDIAKELNEISWDILAILSTKEALSYKEIREFTGISQEKCNKEMARLEGGLLIKSHRDAKDKRHLIFQISSVGLKAMKEKP